MTEKATIELTAIDGATSVLSRVKGAADDLTKSADSIKGAWSGGLLDGFTKGSGLAVVGVLGGITTAALGAGAYFVSLAKQVMEAQAALKSMAEITGASVEGLSAIRSVAKLAGTDMESVAGGMTKLAKNVETGGAEVEGALKAIGLSLKDLQGLKTDEQFMKVTEAMSHYADGAGKTAAAQIILGKSGAQLLPLMKGIGEAGDLVAKTTYAQAVQADDLEKNIKRLTMAKEAWKKVVGAELVPVLDDVVKVLLRLQTESNGTLNATKALAADGSIKTWAQDAALSMAMLVDMGRTLVQALKVAGLEGVLFFAELGAAAAKANALMKPMDGTAKAIAESWATWEADTRKAIAGLESSTFDYGKTQKTLRAEFDASDASIKRQSAHFAEHGDTVGKVRQQVSGLGSAGKDATDKINQLGTSLDDLRNKLDNKDLALAKEMGLLVKGLQTGAMGAAEFGVRMAQAVTQSKAYKEQLDYIVAVQKVWNDLDEAWFQGEEKKRQHIDDTIKSLREETEQIQQETRLLGLSNEERTIAIALLKAQKAGVDTNSAAWAEMAAQMRKAVYDKSAAEETLKNLEDARKQSEQIWKGIGDDISNWIMSGFKNTRDLLKRMFETLVLRPVINPIANSIAGGLQSLLFGDGANGSQGSLLGSVLGLGFSSGQNQNTGGSSGNAGATAGSSGGILAALGVPVGPLAIVAGVAALVSMIAKDEKGFKFDNSLRNVAAAPANVQVSALGNFAPSGDVDGRILGAISPFITKVQALDKYIATNLLSDSTLADVRERIQAMQNPRWWNLEDPQAIEKASKYFLQQRYEAAFRPVNAAVADTIANFGGTADELLKFIDTFILMRKAVEDARTAAANFGQSIATDVQDALDQQSNSVLAAYRAQLRGVDALLNIAPDATDALGQLVTGMAGLRSAAVQMDLQFRQVRASIDSMFGDAIRSLELSTLDPQGQYAYLQNEADTLAAQARAANDPLQIQNLLQRILGDVGQAQGLLSPEQRTLLAPEQISRLRDLQTELQARIADLQAGAQGQMQDALARLSDKLDKVAEAQLAAASKNDAAADKMNNAADKIPEQIGVDIRFTANVPGTAEVGG